MKTINQVVRMTGTAAERATLVDKDVDDNTIIEFTETDTGDKYEWDGDSWMQVGDAGSAHVANQTIHAGERNPTSTTTSYVVVRQECNLTIIGLTTAITIGGGVANDTHLMGINITTALTGTCVITGFADSAGAATSITFPAGSVGFKDFMGAINSAGALTVTCSNAADDNLVQVLWRPV